MKNNQLVYLEDGRKAEYITELNSGEHLVSLLIEVEDSNGVKHEIGNSKEIVSKVLTKPPLELYDKQIKVMLDLKEKTRKDLDALYSEKDKITKELNNYKTDLSKFIINRKDFINAKSIMFFAKGVLEPIVLKDNLTGISVSLSVSIYDGKEKCIGYKIYDNRIDQSFTIDNINTELYFNKSEEDIIQITKNRLDNIKDPTVFYENSWLKIDDKYLSEKLLEYKRDLKAKKYKELRELKLAQIENLKQELNNIDKL